MIRNVCEKVKTKLEINASVLNEYFKKLEDDIIQFEKKGEFKKLNKIRVCIL